VLAFAFSHALRPWTERSKVQELDLRRVTKVAAPRGKVRVPHGMSVEKVRDSGVRGRWIRGSGAPQSAGVLLYVHGGGFVFGSFESHFPLVRRLQAEIGVDAFFVEYRLAPENQYPAAADDVLAAYQYLLDQGVEPASVVVAGDSVGGQLISGLMVDLVDRSLPLPAALLLMSPALDLAATQTLRLDAERRDPILSPVVGLRLLRGYAGDPPPEDRRLHVLEATKDGWPPTLITVGGTECLLGDASSMAASLRNADVPCELQVWPGQVHVFQAFPMLPEARTSLRNAGQFLRKYVPVEARV
jgi:acetyl esterase/lipase